mmetsp:Transcript_20721/g.59400  ORF Transcript_20721/g.59400 Transcript_20721/m.59400 type:complete len:545 (-) Transcript_20721:308-1942(-)
MPKLPHRIGPEAQSRHVQHAQEWYDLNDAASGTARSQHDKLLAGTTNASAEPGPKDVHGGLALDLGFRTQWDVGHLLARVKERVFGNLTHNIEKRTDEKGRGQRRGRPNCSTLTNTIDTGRRGEEPNRESTHGQRHEHGRTLPAQGADNGGSNELHHNGHPPDRLTEGCHEIHVGGLCRVRFPQQGLPQYLGKLNANVVAHHHGGHRFELPGFGQLRQRLPHGGLGLLHRLAAEGNLHFHRVALLGIDQHLTDPLLLLTSLPLIGQIVHDMIQSNDAQTDGILDRGQSLQSRLESNIVVGPLQRYQEGHYLTGHDRGKVPKYGKQWIETLRLRQRGHIVGALPKEEGNTGAGPQLAHNEVQAEAPVPNQAQRSGSGIGHRLHRSTEHGKMDGVPIGIQHKGKQGVEDEERHQRDIEQRLLPQQVRCLGIRHDEHHRARQHAVQLEVGDGFGPAVRHDEGVLGIADGGEDVDEEEHHGGQGEEGGPLGGEDGGLGKEGGQDRSSGGGVGIAGEQMARGGLYLDGAAAGRRRWGRHVDLNVGQVRI